MSASNIARTVQTQQGWTDHTLLEVLLDYIDSQQGEDALADYLLSRTAEVDEWSAKEWG